MGERVVYVVATDATEALRAHKSSNKFYIADVMRVEEDDSSGGEVEHRVFAVDEDRTVAVAVNVSGHALDVAIEVPYVRHSDAERLSVHFLKSILTAKRGLF